MPQLFLEWNKELPFRIVNVDGMERFCPCFRRSALCEFGIKTPIKAAKALAIKVRVALEIAVKAAVAVRAAALAEAPAAVVARPSFYTSENFPIKREAASPKRSLSLHLSKEIPTSVHVLLEISSTI